MPRSNTLLAIFSMANRDPNSPSIIKSPCVENCCLDQDDICVGCFRHLNEILGWHEYSDEKKQQVLVNCQERHKARKNKF